MKTAIGRSPAYTIPAGTFECPSAAVIDVCVIRDGKIKPTGDTLDAINIYDMSVPPHSGLFLVKTGGRWFIITVTGS